MVVIAINSVNRLGLEKSLGFSLSGSLGWEAGIVLILNKFITNLQIVLTLGYNYQ